MKLKLNFSFLGTKSDPLNFFFNFKCGMVKGQKRNRVLNKVFQVLDEKYPRSCLTYILFQCFRSKT